MDEHVSAVFVVGAVDKGFATGCLADRDSITGNRRRFFDKQNFAAKNGRRSGDCLLIWPCEACPNCLKVRPGAGD